jgi:hypothetical protein
MCGQLDGRRIDQRALRTPRSRVRAHSLATNCPSRHHSTGAALPWAGCAGHQGHHRGRRPGPCAPWRSAPDRPLAGRRRASPLGLNMVYICTSPPIASGWGQALARAAWASLGEGRYCALGHTITPEPACLVPGLPAGTWLARVRLPRGWPGGDHRVSGLPGRRSAGSRAPAGSAARPSPGCHGGALLANQLHRLAPGPGRPAYHPEDNGHHPRRAPGGVAHAAGYYRRCD